MPSSFISGRISTTIPVVGIIVVVVASPV